MRPNETAATLEEATIPEQGLRGLKAARVDALRCGR